MAIRRVVQGLLLIVALCLGSVSLHAQGYNLFVMGGGTSLFDKNYFTTNLGPFGSTYSTGTQFSAGGEVPIDRILGLEGSYGWGQDNLMVTQIGVSPATELGFGIRDQRVSGDLVAHIPSILGLHPYLVAGPEYDRFSPYGYAGATFPNFSLDSRTAVLAPSNHAGFNYGGGLELKVFPHVGLRLDVRDHVTGSPAYGLSAYSTLASFFPVKDTANGLEYSAGIVFHFGRNW